MNAPRVSRLAGRVLDEGSDVTPSLSGLDAREALAFWRGRLARLPWHRRAARREARMMVSRSRARLVTAHLEARGLGALAFIVQPLLDLLARPRRDHMRWVWLALVRRNPIVRRWLLTVAVVAAVSLTSLTGLAVFAVHLIAS